MNMFNLSSKKLYFFIFFLFVFLPDYAVCEQPRNRDYWPTKGWVTSTPEKQGMDAAKLMIADQFIQNRLPDAFSPKISV